MTRATVKVGSSVKGGARAVAADWRPNFPLGTVVLQGRSPLRLVEGDGRADEPLEGRLVDLVAPAEVDGAHAVCGPASLRPWRSS